MLLLLPSHCTNRWKYMNIKQKIIFPFSFENGHLRMGRGCGHVWGTYPIRSGYDTKKAFSSSQYSILRPFPCPCLLTRKKKTSKDERPVKPDGRTDKAKYE